MPYVPYTPAKCVIDNLSELLSNPPIFTIEDEVREIAGMDNGDGGGMDGGGGMDTNMGTVGGDEGGWDMGYEGGKDGDRGMDGGNMNMGIIGGDEGRMNGGNMDMGTVSGSDTNRSLDGGDMGDGMNMGYGGNIGYRDGMDMGIGFGHHHHGFYGGGYPWYGGNPLYGLSIFKTPGMNLSFTGIRGVRAEKRAKVSRKKSVKKQGSPAGTLTTKGSNVSSKSNIQLRKSSTTNQLKKANKPKRNKWCCCCCC